MNEDEDEKAHTIDDMGSENLLKHLKLRSQALRGTDKLYLPPSRPIFIFVSADTSPTSFLPEL